MRRPLLEHVVWLFLLRGRWLRCLMLALVACVLWGVCLSRAARLWLVADDAYRQTGSIHDFNDLNWANFIGVSYLLCFATGLSFWVLAQRKDWAFLGIFGGINMFTAAWLNIQRPEHVIAFFPTGEPALALLANLILVVVALINVLARKGAGHRSMP